MPGRSDPAGKHGNDNNSEHDPGDRKTGDDSTASRGTGALRSVHQAYAFEEYPSRRRFGRSALQPQREAAGTHFAAVGALRQARYAGTDGPQHLARSAGGNGRDNEIAGQFVLEQFQKAGVHRVRRQAARASHQ